MNLSKQLAMLASSAILALSFFGCSSDKDPDEVIDFKSYTGAQSSIQVDNASNVRLVAFKGTVKKANLISGIPAHASNHGLKKEANLFTGKTGDFALVVISEDEYIRCMDNLDNNCADIFSEIYAFYNDAGDNNNVFKISGLNGGKGRIRLDNPTNWNIEIRKDGPTGEVLGYVAQQLTGTSLRLQIPGDYNLFPIFKRYNTLDKEIYEVVPKYTSGNLIGKPYMMTFALDSEEPQLWNFEPLASQLNFEMSSGGFYLRIQNDAGVAVSFKKGMEEVTTSTGTKGIKQNTTNLYNIRIERNLDGTYPEEQTVVGYSIGTVQYNIPIPEHVYKTDYIYHIRVTGTDASNLAISDITESDEPMDIEKALSNY